MPDDPTAPAMNLRSCDNCGVVLDANKLIFPDQKNWWREDGTYDESMSAWDSWTMTQRAKISCPACGANILKLPSE
jgi:predicted RNA-binding Zn-ribbon protein involved in translation (DUF1610 family)